MSSAAQQPATKHYNGHPDRTHNSFIPRQVGIGMVGLGSPVIPYQLPVRHQNGTINGEDVPDTTPTKRTYITGNRNGRVEVSMVSRKRSSCNGPMWEAAPKFSRELRDTEVDEGDIVCFDTQYACHPAADVQWLKNDMEVVQTDWCRVYTTDSGSMLVLCDVNESDNAQYRVTVSNLAGNITSTANLLVYVKGLKLSVISVHSQRVMSSCENDPVIIVQNNRIIRANHFQIFSKQIC